MTLRDAMDNCRKCHDLYQEVGGICGFDKNGEFRDRGYVAMDTIDLIEADGDITEEGSLPQLMVQACYMCKFDAPRVENLGKAHLRE